MARKGTPITIFGVNFPNLAFALKNLGLPYVFERQIKERYGSVEDYIRRKYSDLGEAELGALCQRATQGKIEIGSGLAKHMQLALNVYLNSTMCTANERERMILRRLASTKDFTTDLETALEKSE